MFLQINRVLFVWTWRVKTLRVSGFAFSHAKAKRNALAAVRARRPDLSEASLRSPNAPDWQPVRPTDGGGSPSWRRNVYGGRR